MSSNRLSYRQDTAIGSVLKQMLCESGLAAGMDDHLIRKAWDKAVSELFPGLDCRAIRKWYRREDGTLFITLPSSVMANHFRMYQGALLEKVNAILEQDEFFIKAANNGQFINKISIR